MTEKTTQDSTQKKSNSRRTFLDFGPLLLFFGANYVYHDLMFSVKVLVLATLISLGRNPLAALMGSQIKLDSEGWRKLSWLWVSMFVCSAIANEIAWRSLSTDSWVTFKVFGLTGISLIFVVLTLPVIQKHQLQDQ